MAESGRAVTVIRIDAPYVSNIISMLNHGYDVEHTLFYRTNEPSLSGSPKDLFALGNFTEHFCLWDDHGKNCEPTIIRSQLTSALQMPLSLAGYMSYELGYSFEKRWQCLGVPDSGYAYRFVEVDCWYEADHGTMTGAIYAYYDCSKQNKLLLQNVVGECAKRKATFPMVMNETVKLPLEQIAGAGELTCDEYKVQALQILDDISAGRFYELNFTQRFNISSEKSPAKAFQNLFATYQPQRAFYCHLGSEVVGSCSPELFLKKEQSNVFTRPIKGSFAVQTNPSEKAKLHAEHVMVVDLARNDIGRVSNIDWVRVPEFATTSSFGGLNHLESLVAGRTSLQLDQILSLTYPAASITGAPKVEVVRAIAQYEKSCRGVYTGACGWKCGSGDFDFNVAIRTFVATKQSGEWAYIVGAGGAIVADSFPDQEYIECLQKAQPLLSELMSNE